MIKINLRYYVYIAAGAAAVVLLLLDPDVRASEHVAELFGSLASLSRQVVEVFR